jgi:hypothetical protein
MATPNDNAPSPDDGILSWVVAMHEEGVALDLIIASLLAMGIKLALDATGTSKGCQNHIDMALARVQKQDAGSLN